MSEAKPKRVWFASNRVFEDPERDGRDPVATLRRAPTLSLGLAEVKIPDAHKRGVIEALPPLALNPAAYSKFELGSVLISTCDAKPHLINSSHDLIKESFAELMDQHREDWRSKRCFVFIHGYNETFDHAIFTAAQMHHDLPYEGIPMVFSWPSAGTYQGYTYDQESIQISRQYLLQFFEALLQLGINDISIIAHSLGVRLVLEALGILKLKTAAGIWRKHDYIGAMLQEVIFCHPDVSVTEFRLEMRTICDPGFPPLANRFSIFANQTDKALGVSAPFHGSEELRLGAGAAQFEVTSADMVDLSPLHVAAMDWGHNLYRDNDVALGIMGSLLRHESLEDCPLLQNVGKRSWRALP